MLLGRDDVIFSINPIYRTDALLRKVNVDRYDDRVIVQTNLIDSYDLLMQFAAKHLLDKFHLEDDARVSLRGVIAREMLVNTLMHREFITSFHARFVIEKDRMYTENANRAVSGDVIMPDNFEPNSKNPIIAAFFRNIGYADELGSGMRRLHYFVPRYSGKKPELIEGDIFRIIVPLDDSYSFETGIVNGQLKDKDPVNDANGVVNGADGANNGADGANNELRHILVLDLIRGDPTISLDEISSKTGISQRTLDRLIAELKDSNIIKRSGTKRSGYWQIIDKNAEESR
jgi:ATP-dependent DNA helicase RecG